MTIKRKSLQLLLALTTVGSLASQSLISVQASEKPEITESTSSENIKLITGDTLNSVIEIQNEPVQGGGGDYTHSYSYQSSTSQAQAAVGSIAGYLVGVGITKFFPSTNEFRQWLDPIVTADIGLGLSRVNIVYYDVFIGIQNTSYGQSVRNVLRTYSDPAMTNLIGTRTNLYHNYN